MAGVAGAVLLLLTGCGGGTGEGNGCHTSAQLEQADSLLLLGQNSPSFQTLHANIALCAPPDVAVRSMAESWQDFRSSMNLLQTRDVDIVEAIGIDLSELAQAGELLALNRLDIKAVDRTLDAYHPTLVNAVTAGKNVYALPFGFDAQIQLYRASVTKPAKDLDDLIEMGQEGVSVAFPSADGVAIFDSFTALFYGHGGDWRDIKEKPLQRAYADFKQLYLLMSADQRDKTAQEIRDGLDNGTVDIALLWGSWARTLIAAGGTPGAISPAPAPKGSKEVASSLLIQGLALPRKDRRPRFSCLDDARCGEPQPAQQSCLSLLFGTQGIVTPSKR